MKEIAVKYIALLLCHIIYISPSIVHSVALQHCALPPGRDIKRWSIYYCRKKLM